jgi:hypothetical protein
MNGLEEPLKNKDHVLRRYTHFNLFGLSFLGNRIFISHIRTRIEVIQ